MVGTLRCGVRSAQRADPTSGRENGVFSHHVRVKLHPKTRCMTSLDYYGIEDLLTGEERAARDRARRFVQEEAMPEIVPCHRAAKFPEHLTARMGALRFFAPYLKEYGC